MKKYKLVILWSLVFAIMLAIFLFSNDSGGSSSAKSNFFVGIVKKIVVPFIDKEYYIENEVRITRIISNVVRKTAHFSIFAMLSLALYFALKYSFSVRIALIFTVPLCFIYALSDEFHQTFVKGRSGNFIDSIIDTLGAIFIILIVLIIYLIRRKKVGE